MINRNGPVIDMTPEGRFIERPRPSFSQILTRVAIFGVAVGVAGVMLWTLVLVLPVLLLAGAVGYFVLRHQMRRGMLPMRRPAPWRGRPQFRA